MKRRLLRKGLVLVVMAIVMQGCNSKGQPPTLPDSSGRPYEVLLTANDTSAARLVERLLSVPCTALPQTEPQFDVAISASQRLSPSTRRARAIVVVETDSSRFAKTPVRYEKNVYARPQLIVHIATPSAQRLTNDMNPKAASHLRQLLTDHEMTAEKERLAHNRNSMGEQMADSMFHLSLMVPAELSYTKRGNRFLWLSNNAPQAMRNICLYSYDGLSLDPSVMISRRDSIMRANLPGEQPGMYMQTAASPTNASRHGNLLIVSGLWEMKGDMMGGPFTMRAMADSARHRVVVAEAFVYAPEQRKRNLMRQLEAALQTFTITQ